ncbi:hypothetical protein F8M41_007471 [Gigaspora margarita]|uniref:Uncharacterized protein n=1 Tax=Gigaspora margarita TaxID=4874 RepID=A0A8H3X5N4_GIGMA|nr:hypothetical protein F8M41_007471 [Gigaspora margarita]
MASKLTCILYLEPSHSSQFYQSILKFYDQSLKLVGPNNAHQYDPHISMTGFFTLYDSQRIINNCNIDENHEYISAYKKLDQIIQFIDNFLNNNHNITYPLVKNIIFSNSKNLLIPLQVCQEMLDLVNQLSQLSFDESNSNSNILAKDNSTKTIIRPKAINHLSLAYYEDGFFSNNTMKNLESMANKFIVFDEVKEQKCGWDIVIYEKIHHSIRIEEKHVFREIKRWNIF